MSEKRLGMLIDLTNCIGCGACVVACKMENDVPLTCFNTWVDSWDVDAGDNGIRRVNLPAQCNHCDAAPCVEACPTGASYKADDGTVQVNQDECIGCEACIKACPFGARYVTGATVDKCSFCHHRTTLGMLPACANTCVTYARTFGDLNDPESAISKKLASANAEVLQQELDLGQAIYYIGLSESTSLPVVSAVHRGGNVLEAYAG